MASRWRNQPVARRDAYGDQECLFSGGKVPIEILLDEPAGRVTEWQLRIEGDGPIRELANLLGALGSLGQRRVIYDEQLGQREFGPRRSELRRQLRRLSEIRGRLVGLGRRPKRARESAQVRIFSIGIESRLGRLLVIGQADAERAGHASHQLCLARQQACPRRGELAPLHSATPVAPSINVTVARIRESICVTEPASSSSTPSFFATSEVPSLVSRNGITAAND